MRLILLGPPGAGKGTQSVFLTKYFHIPQISTGDMLRSIMQSDSSIANDIKNIINAGKLVSDELIIKLVIDRISQNDCQNGYLLDGFPRNVFQAQALEKINIKINFVINIELSEKIIVDRISGRLIHPASGRTYHINLKPPINQGIDDITGEPLIQRDDDKVETVKNRLSIYYQKTKPLIDYYLSLSKLNNNAPKYLQISGLGTVEEVRDRILSHIL
ncbi:Adenylate kinase [Candidatus Kinetoplastibacterium sorsogonicusi]|uniref:Adenylate kinase n=1 Tax=Candidatus Kinetoplastidibacterium kentomonadis TaxID=1576550 RepID=A0A3S7J9P4_9PROT|nr:adenylate kinase [Candidatus Kinetoplastibacterium sorsogonicusi]AWD32393.1 Adenylate kinase [Candidatus Kinetoplastibacterium sorsogonicusi]